MSTLSLGRMKREFGGVRERERRSRRRRRGWWYSEPFRDSKPFRERRTGLVLQSLFSQFRYQSWHKIFDLIYFYLNKLFVGGGDPEDSEFI